ncbi:IclR family transcriptional regulator [Crossiella cryophila]|uniref:DNA-binding IclR family transcriptional regulator n=1 Tax=Crossiella cryophila TaxID=43355 RepID=A0A7W7CG77_9PSEU|nr:IclR family transcriptional regulator C-terminal domain-containing protein [Crossiella cryophila]MBB4678919.1 DNA-binding IclR family transcriptional regulator [Crossiella cryophila]
MSDLAPKRPHHRAVDRIAAILETVATEPQGLGLTQLALRLDAPVSSIQKLVNGLVAVGYLDETDHRFTLGAAPYLLSLRAGRVPARVVRHADLVALSREHRCSAVLAVRLGDASVYVDWAGTDDPFNYLTVRQLRTPLPETAVGRVLLAHLPERERHEVVSAHVGGEAEAALGLLAELAEIREDGFSLGDSGPMLRGIAAVAAPVWAEGVVVGAVSLAGRREGVGERLPELAEVLVSAVREWAGRAVER